MATLSSGLVDVTFSLEEHVQNVTELMERFSSLPMSLADACIVRMAETLKDSSVLTFDSDFLIYRKNRNESIAIISP